MSRAVWGSLLGAIALAGCTWLPGCVGTNVTLGTPADDPEVPHRAPSAVPRGTATPTAVPAPTRTPLPDAAPVANNPVPDSASPPAEPARTAAPGPVSPPPPPAAATTASPLAQSLGDPVTLAAEPCRSKGLHVRAVVPRPEDLDLSQRGAVPGIEIRKTVRSGTGGFRHATLAGGIFEADVWVRGSGLAAGALGKETCTGGGAADVSFEIVARYRR